MSCDHVVLKYEIPIFLPFAVAVRFLTDIPYHRWIEQGLRSKAVPHYQH